MLVTITNYCCLFVSCMQIPVPPESARLAPNARFTSQLVRVSVNLLVISTMEVAWPIKSAR